MNTSEKYFRFAERKDTELVLDFINRIAAYEEMPDAVKYTKEGSIRLKVGGRKENGDIILSFAVTDTGIGMKQEFLKDIFIIKILTRGDII